MIPINLLLNAKRRRIKPVSLKRSPMFQGQHLIVHLLIVVYQIIFRLSMVLIKIYFLKMFLLFWRDWII